MSGETTSTIHTAPWAEVQGPLAQAQALGAPEAVVTGTYWNAPQLPNGDPQAVAVPLAHERGRLAERYGIRDAQSWTLAVDTYLRGHHITGTAAERALDIREDVLDHEPGAYLGLPEWLQAIENANARANAGADGEEVFTAAAKSFYIEAALTDAGLLPPGVRVVTHFAADVAVAVHLVQAGFRLGFCDPQHATDILDAAWHNSASVYRDWEQFGAAYVAAQSSQFGSYPVDTVWRRATATIRLLLSQPDSPWLSLPYPQRPSQPGVGVNADVNN